MATAASAPAQPPSPPPPAEHIFILSGQSNMVGHGGFTRGHGWDGVVPPESRPDPSVLRLSAALLWEEAREPLHRDIPTGKTRGVGPGMAFANALRERGGGAGRVGRVGLVPCAVGSTAIRKWARGGHLYESMVRRARESVKDGGEIKALLWYQGESDTAAEHDAEAYRGNMEALIKNVRGDLGLPSLPVIQVAIASGNERYMDRVRRAQLEIELPNVVCVDAMGLPLNDDHLHLTTHAQVRLGHMLADAYLQHFAP
ncbi:probable carbohydrate esterase At4g34215 [Rhodamnia argentea]|uniref:Probable carbohydrate esterase At4g34215 n=1 Tax=Rhodamnia argentea TaxID=178133 RepID=A0ABM3HE64_9MYRT|nr:probable carbohydrate esterase At4g34215 [Rhodamnia argentea]